MKKLILFLVITMVTITSKATIRRVQYWGNPVAGIDYATCAAAVVVSTAGDTILVFQYSNEGFTIDRRLVIIGPGYFNWLTADANFNPNLQNIQPSGTLGIIFAPGSDGSIVTGCRLSINTSGNVAINYIKIRNCTNYGAGYWYVGSTGSNLTFDNWEFSKCDLGYYIIMNNGTNKFTNLKMFNCLGDGAYTGVGSLQLSSMAGHTGIIENCSFQGGGANLVLNSNNFLVQNCIFYAAYPSAYSNTIFNNNIFTQTPSPAVTGSGNIFNAVAANIFVGIPTLGTSSTDGKFILKAGSPAIGAGISGVDCGAYGGVNPYKLSLIPAIPAFYKLTSAGTAATTNPYQITFSVRANN